MRFVVVELITGLEIFATDSFDEAISRLHDEFELFLNDPVIAGVYRVVGDRRILSRLEYNSFARARYNI